MHRLPAARSAKGLRPSTRLDVGRTRCRCVFTPETECVDGAARSNCGQGPIGQYPKMWTARTLVSLPATKKVSSRLTTDLYSFFAVIVSLCFSACGTIRKR